MQRYWANVTYNEDQTIAFCAHVAGEDALESIIREAIAHLKESYRRPYVIREVHAVAVNLVNVGKNAWSFVPVEGSKAIETPEGFSRQVKWPKS